MNQQEQAIQQLDLFTRRLLKNAAESRAYLEAGKARRASTGRPSARAIAVTEPTVREEEALARGAQGVRALFNEKR